QVAARAQSTMVLFDPDRNFAQKIAAVGTNYAKEFGPDLLFWKGDDINMQVQSRESRRTPDFGRLLHVELPFAVIGVALTLIRARPSPTPRFLLIGLAVHPLPAALCDGWNPHALRDILALPLWSIVSAIGVVALWNWLSGSPSLLRIL